LLQNAQGSRYETILAEDADFLDQKHGFSEIYQRHQTDYLKFKIGNRNLAGSNSLLDMFSIRAPEGITEKGGASVVTFQLFFLDNCFRL